MRRLDAGLGEDRLEQPAVVEPDPAANRERPGRVAGQASEHAARPRRRVRESETRLEVVGVIAKAVVEPVFLLARRFDELVAQTQVERQVRADAPVVLDVGVVLLRAILEEERAPRILIAGDTPIEHGRIGRGVHRAAAARVERPEAAAKVLGEIVEALEAQVGAGLELMTAPEEPRDVVDELVIGLLAIDGEVAGIADDRARHRRIREADDRRVVAGGDVDARATLSKPVAELADRRLVDDMRPGDAGIALAIVLARLLAPNHVIRLEDLTRPLVAPGHRVNGVRRPIEPQRMVVGWLIDGLRGLVGPRAPRVVRRDVGKAGQDVLDERAVLRRVVAPGQARRGQLAGQEQITRVGLVALETLLVGADESEDAVPPDGETGGAAVLIARVVRLRRGKRTLGIPRAVLVEVIQIPVDLIGAGLGLYQDDGSVAAAELRGVGVGDDLELLDGRQRRALPVLVLGRIVVVDAVDLKRRAARAGAVEIDRRAGRRGRVVLPGRRVLAEPGEGFREREKAARIERRPILDLLCAQRAFDLAAGGVDVRRLGPHGDGFGNRRG